MTRQGTGRRRRLALALLLPLLGLLALVVRAEWILVHAPTWRFEIEGRDPRDMLKGHYLAFTLKLRFDEKGPLCGGERLDPRCCLCLTRDGTTNTDPYARQVECDAARSCDGWLASDAVRDLRYYASEEDALRLAALLQERPMTVSMSVDAEGRPAHLELFVDGEPWRESNWEPDPVRARTQPPRWREEPTPQPAVTDPTPPQ
jgi:hypothetical protein